MKKQLALAVMSVLSVSTALTYAATPVLNLTDALRGDKLDFGYTSTQDVVIKGFQAGADAASKEFVISSPLLKDSSDLEVNEYSILVSKNPISSYKNGTGELNLADFDETKFTLSADDRATGEATLKLSATNLEADATYYGVVVPTDSLMQEGQHSKEFCLNFSTEKFAEGEACADFSTASTDVESDSDEEHAAAGANMRMAAISHTISTDNKVTLTWKAQTQSANLEIQLYDTASDEFITLATVPMTQEKFEYVAKTTDQELIFNFIPRDEKGKEIRYEVNARTETEVKPEIKSVPKVGPVEDMMLIVAITVLAYAGYRLIATNRVE